MSVQTLAQEDLKLAIAQFGLDPANPWHEAGYLVAADLYKQGLIVSFDPSIIIVIIEILQVLLPILQEYCPAESARIAANAQDLDTRPVQRWRWLATVRSRTLRTVGARGWRDVGGYGFANQLFASTARNENDIVGRLLAVCG